MFLLIWSLEHLPFPLFLTRWQHCICSDVCLPFPSSSGSGDGARLPCRGWGYKTYRSQGSGNHEISMGDCRSPWCTLLGTFACQGHGSLGQGVGRVCVCVEDVIRYIDGLMQERHNSIAYALELRLSCSNPTICVQSRMVERSVYARMDRTASWWYRHHQHPTPPPPPPPPPPQRY